MKTSPGLPSVQGGPGTLQRHQHVRALVPDGLERADRAAELDPLPGVADRQIQRLPGPADRLAVQGDTAKGR